MSLIVRNEQHREFRFTVTFLSCISLSIARLINTRRHTYLRRPVLHQTSNMFARYLFIVCVLSCSAPTPEGAGLNEEFTWTRLSYVWPQESRFGYGRPSKPVLPSGGDIAFPEGVNTERSKTSPRPPQAQTAPEDGDVPPNMDYIYENNVPMGANRWGDKLFITVPRRRAGVPSTLNYVSMSSKEKHNVPLTPYPDWESNQLDASPDKRLVSVYRVAVDACDRLWMIDTGIIEILGNRTDVAKHSIVIFDLKTDKMIHRYTLNDADLRCPSVLALITVDVTPDKCDDAYAYMPDLAGYGLVVYSLKENRSWRVNHNYFFLEPLAGEYNIGGQTFQWNDGVFSVALSDVGKDGFRDMYFHSMSGTNLYKVSTRVLRNESMATRSYHGDDFQLIGDRGKLSQTSATDLHKPSGVLFLNLVNRNALGCWNTNQPFSPDNFHIVQKDAVKMIYPCDVKVYKDDVVLLTNNMPIFLYGRLNYDEVNFRVWMNTVQGAVGGTLCAPRRSSGRPSYG